MSTHNQTNPQNNYRFFCVNEQKEPRFLAKRNKILETNCVECRLNLKKMMFPFIKRSKNLQDWRIIESGTFFTMQNIRRQKIVYKDWQNEKNTFVYTNCHGMNRDTKKAEKETSMLSNFKRRRLTTVSLYRPSGYLLLVMVPAESWR